MSLQHIQKNSPRLLPKPAKFEKNPPNGYRVIRKTKWGAGGAAGAGGARSSPIHKQASLAGRLIITKMDKPMCMLISILGYLIYKDWLINGMKEIWEYNSIMLYIKYELIGKICMKNLI